MAAIKLKPEQEKAIEDLLAGKDVLAVLPTGFGKSLIYKSFADVKNLDNEAVVLVISPLTSIIKDQILHLNTELNSSYAAELSTLSSEQLKGCDFKILFSSAEDALKEEFTEELKNNASELHKRLSLIVVDETHTVETWSGKRCRSRKKTKTRNKKPFRSAYGRLSTLRSLCNEGVPVLALTATADKKSQGVICAELLMKNPEKIIVSPHRENLRFSVSRYTKEEIHKGLDWLVTMVKENGIKTPKTILFCNTMKEISAVVNHLLVKLGKYAFYPCSSTRREDMIIGIYHSMTWQSNKTKIMKSLNEDGTKRIIVATTALSMGVNFLDIRFIINWGPARTLLDQHQEAGRAGRDGKQSYVIILYHGQQLSFCEEDVKEFVNTEGCLRVAAYKPFDDSIKPIETGHNCCSNCAKNCSCGLLSCPVLPFESPACANENEPTEFTARRTVTEDDTECLKQAFLEVRESMPQSCCVFGDTHGFSLELIDSIIEHSDKLFTLKDLQTYLPVFSLNHGIQILEVLDEVFSDIPNFECEMHVVDSDLQQDSPSGHLDSGLCYASEDIAHSIHEEQLLSLTEYLDLSSESDNSDLSDIDVGENN